MRTDGVQMDGEAISAARKAVADRYDAGYVPDKPRHYTRPRPRMRRKRMRRSARPISTRDQAGVGRSCAALRADLEARAGEPDGLGAAGADHASSWPTAPASTTLRATGQVVLFPGFLALYEEGRDDAEDEDSAPAAARCATGDAPAKNGVEAEQHFTQPPPRYSEASLVKRMEELGIGRPSTYASTLQTLKDRDYVRLEKNRFIPEESGRLVTAFLERFFERYVGYDFTAGLEDELDDVSGGRAQWQAVLEAFWRDFKPQDRRGDGAEAVARSPRRSTNSSRPGCSRDKGDGSDPRLCPLCGTGRLALRGGKFGAFVACSNYPECKYHPPVRPAGRRATASDTGPRRSGSDPESGLEVTAQSGRFGPYIQLGEGKEAKRASIPKDVPGEDSTSTGR